MAENSKFGVWVAIVGAVAAIAVAVINKHGSTQQSNSSGSTESPAPPTGSNKNEAKAGDDSIVIQDVKAGGDIITNASHPKDK